MKLPNGDKAVVDMRTLTEYCLSPDHPTGKHKARVFASAMGMTVRDAEPLRRILLAAAGDGEATVAKTDTYGSRFVIESSAEGVRGPVRIRSVWVVRSSGRRAILRGC